MERLRANLTTAWNFTGELMRGFRETVTESSGRMAGKVAGLGELLAEDPLETSKNSIVLAFEPAEGLEISEVLFYLTVMECFVAVLVLMGMSSGKMRERLG
jgi:hypothetical protein